MMAEQKKTGQIQIFAKNIRGNASGEILEESKYTRNFAGAKFVQGGNKGGVNNGQNRERKEQEVNNSIEGVVVFRRIETNYAVKPDFGFDWYAGINNGTAYKEPFNYENLVMSGKDQLKKEYVSYNKFISIRKFGYLQLTGSSGKSVLNINGSQYYTPWFSGFAKDEAGTNKTYELDVFFDIKKPAEGRIRIGCKEENLEVVFSDIGETSFNIDESFVGQKQKKIKITFLDYITESTCITISFHKKTDEEKAEEKKRAEDMVAGKTPDSVQTLYVTTGELMGVLNVSKNNLEYDLHVHYVKVFFKGWIKFEGYKEKIYLSKRNPIGTLSDYEEHDDVKKRRTKIEKQKSDLEYKLIEIQYGKKGLFGSNEQKLKLEIAKKEAELINLTALNKARIKTSQDLYQYQEKNMIDYESKIKNWDPFYKDVFSQALTKYITGNPSKNVTFDEIEIDVDDFDSYFDDLMLIPKGADFYLMDDDSETANTDRIMSKVKSKLNQSKEHNYIYLVPFKIYSEDDKSSTLRGEAESVSRSANSALITPEFARHTIPHEFGHTLNLMHIFENKFLFWGNNIDIKQGTTDKIMDYTDLGKESKGEKNITIKTSFTKWQWDTIQKDPNVIATDKKK